MNIESMAVSAVQNAISKTDYLGEQISKGDKEPSWDGSIYVYNTPADNHKKKIIEQLYLYRLRERK